jgi:hypothetical protein
MTNQEIRNEITGIIKELENLEMAFREFPIYFQHLASPISAIEYHTASVDSRTRNLVDEIWRMRKEALNDHTRNLEDEILQIRKEETLLGCQEKKTDKKKIQITLTTVFDFDSITKIYCTGVLNKSDRVTYHMFHSQQLIIWLDNELPSNIEDMLQELQKEFGGALEYAPKDTP